MGMSLGLGLIFLFLWVCFYDYYYFLLLLLVLLLLLLLLLLLFICGALNRTLNPRPPTVTPPWPEARSFSSVRMPFSGTSLQLQ